LLPRSGGWGRRRRPPGRQSFGGRFEAGFDGARADPAMAAELAITLLDTTDGLAVVRL